MSGRVQYHTSLNMSQLLLLLGLLHGGRGRAGGAVRTATKKSAVELAGWLVLVPASFSPHTPHC
jgi:hypothetical protein